MKRFFERAVMNFITINELGTSTTVSVASSGEIVYIMMITPVMVSVALSIWLSDCCRHIAMLSMSLVTRPSRSPRGCWST